MAYGKGNLGQQQEIGTPTTNDTRNIVTVLTISHSGKGVLQSVTVAGGTDVYEIWVDGAQVFASNADIGTGRFDFPFETGFEIYTPSGYDTVALIKNEDNSMEFITANLGVIGSTTLQVSETGVGRIKAIMLASNQKLIVDGVIMIEANMLSKRMFVDIPYYQSFQYYSDFANPYITYNKIS